MRWKPIREVKYLVVHCSATKEDQDFGAEDIRGWHQAKGWLDIGYHYVIKRDGSIERGRPDTQPGAHARGFNHLSLGICLIGGVDSNGNPEDNYSPEQMQSLDILLTQYEIWHPEATILGHRDLPSVAKACPCFDVQEWWGDLNGTTPTDEDNHE